MRHQLLCLVVGMVLSAQTAQAAIEVVKNQAYQSTTVLGGTVVPFREVVLTSQLQGRVNFLAGVEGDRFANGALLVAVDDADLQAQRREMMAQYQKAQSALRNAQTEYNRELWNPQSKSISKAPGFAMPSMFDQMFARPMGQAMGFEDHGITRQADLYNRNAALQQANADVMRAQAAVEGLDTKIRDARSVAPFQGLIIEKMVEAGDTVVPGQPLIRFAQSGHLCIEVNVPVRLMGKIDRGDVLQAHLDQIGQTPVRVAQVYPVADPQQHTVKVKLDLPLGVMAGPGMYAEIVWPNLVESQQGSPVVPKNAIVKRGSLPNIYVANDDDVIEMRFVRLGRSVDEHHVSVLSGVKEGERVVTQPAKSIASGWLVRGGDVVPPVERK